MIRLIVILFLMPLVLQSASAKRIAPVKVDPLVYKGVRYVAPNDDGRNGGDDFEWMDSWKVYLERVLPMRRLKSTFHVSAGTHFWLKRAKPPAR